MDISTYLHMYLGSQFMKLSMILKDLLQLTFKYKNPKKKHEIKRGIRTYVIFMYI